MLKELQYPFDAEYIIQNKRKLRRILLEKSTKDFLNINIAILGGYTTDDIRRILEIFLLEQGIRPNFYESEYNQFYQDAIFDNEKLANFAPNVIYVCTSNRNIQKYPKINQSKDEIDEMLRSEVAKYVAIWDSLEKKYNCPIIQNNFEMPIFRLLGNRDSYDIHGRVNYLTRLNMAFYEHAAARDNLHICDINFISADYGLSKWSEPFYWYMYKYALAVEAIPYLAFNVSNIIKSIFGKNKKGLVLDLDNTLWGGVIGDDGVENIAIGTEEAEAQAFLDFQRYIKAQESIGVILNIDSKNDFENALLGLSHPDNALKESDFALIKANWDSKDKNFLDIADTLNLLPESLVFIDDNPAERHIVTQQIENVAAPDIGKVTDYIKILDRAGFFEVTSLTSDDTKRSQMYIENARRKEQQAKFSDYSEYLLSLEMKAEIKNFAPVYYARIAQLTNKSNQFNLTTKRYTQQDIEAIAEDSNYISLYGKLADKFGDNGVVSIVIGHVDGGVCDIKLWLMSCRVLKRDMEYAMLDKLVSECRARDIKLIHGHYYPTAKNKMVRDFFSVMGFEKLAEDPDGNADYALDISAGYENKNKVINVEA